MVGGISSPKCKRYCSHWGDNEAVMNIEMARQRIDSAIAQYGPHAGPAIDLLMSEVRSDMGAKAFNELVEEFDLELLYNIAPMETDYSNS